ncbi:hypothetical protein HDF16_001061 [Granulicella aggregans]|uniref:Uncharacterized protein n=1 Tax=Granulicella aggregans TaxID=474949 RepID=A0A7W7ZAV0_9BACT|nr:hypothetical protein [Granulicella aggregans]
MLVPPGLQWALEASTSLPISAQIHRVGSHPAVYITLVWDTDSFWQRSCTIPDNFLSLEDLKARNTSAGNVLRSQEESVVVPAIGAMT